MVNKRTKIASKLFVERAIAACPFYVVAMLSAIVNLPIKYSEHLSCPGARFSKVPIINGPGKLSPFTLKIEVSIVLNQETIKGTERASPIYTLFHR